VVKPGGVRRDCKPRSVPLQSLMPLDIFILNGPDRVVGALRPVAQDRCRVVIFKEVSS